MQIAGNNLVAAVVFRPRMKNLGRFAPFWIGGASVCDPRDRVLAVECHQRIANPCRPLLEPTERRGAFEFGSGLPAPTPNGERGPQEFGPLARDVGENVAGKAA